MRSKPTITTLVALTLVLAFVGSANACTLITPKGTKQKVIQKTSVHPAFRLVLSWKGILHGRVRLDCSGSWRFEYQPKLKIYKEAEPGWTKISDTRFKSGQLGSKANLSVKFVAQNWGPGWGPPGSPRGDWYRLVDIKIGPGIYWPKGLTMHVSVSSDGNSASVGTPL